MYYIFSFSTLEAYNKYTYFEILSEYLERDKLTTSLA